VLGGLLIITSRGSPERRLNGRGRASGGERSATEPRSERSKPGRGNQEDIDLAAALVVIGSVAALTIMWVEAAQGWQLPEELLTSSDSLSWRFRYFCPDMPAQRVDDLCR
jgi:hypothetical protein